MNLAPQEISRDVLREKYCQGEESTVEEVRRRVARALASVESAPEQWEERFFEAQVRGIVMAGRINASAGTSLATTLINCFVQPVGDSFVKPDADGTPGIFAALRDAADTMRRGGGVGRDVADSAPGAATKVTAGARATR